MEAEKREFDGVLDKISPSKIIDKIKEDELDQFFLVLAVVFNDLKGLIFFDNLLRDIYRNPTETEEPSCHVGEFGGLSVQISKLLMGSIQEFLRFLEENERVINGIKFQFLLKNTNSDVKKSWSDIVGVALGYSVKGSKFANDLIQVRNNASFHYYQSGKSFKKSFRDWFFTKSKHDKNKVAYYALGNNMKSTRFFYADATVEEYIRSAAVDSSKDSKVPINSDKRLRKMIDNMNILISCLIREYLIYKEKVF